MSTVSEAAVHRGITEIVHFTTNLGLTGCLHKEALLSRSHLTKEESLSYILTLNSPFRMEEEPWFDNTENWISFVNLSITEITTNLFKHSLKWHSGRDIYWVILSFDAKILDHEGVYFSTTNNIYPDTIRGVGVAGFEALFEPKIIRKARQNWVVQRGNRASNLATCEQAEVLYPDAVPLKFLRKVYVREAEQADRVSAVLANFDRGDVEIVAGEEKFRGKTN